jgi:ferric-dicitrate binding protein FerR (iron transport regulator)
MKTKESIYNLPQSSNGRYPAMQILSSTLLGKNSAPVSRTKRIDPHLAQRRNAILLLLLALALCIMLPWLIQSNKQAYWNQDLSTVIAQQ